MANPSSPTVPNTELIFILDRSGSMSGLESDTIGGFNGLIERQRATSENARVTTVLFDDQRDVVYDRTPISQVEPLTSERYYARGCTALLDAIGSTICSVEKTQRRDKGSASAKTIAVITTDGLENASTEFTLSEVRRLIQRKEEEGWEFLFLGANIDAVATAATIGIPAQRAAQYEPSAEGTAVNFETLGGALDHMRACPSAPLPESWKTPIEKLRQRRQRHRS